MDQILRFFANPSFPVIIGALIGVAMGLALYMLVLANCLSRAIRWFKFETISFWKAFSLVLIDTLLFPFVYGIPSLTQSFMSTFQSRGRMDVERMVMSEVNNPLQMLIVVLIGLVLFASLLTCTVREPSGSERQPGKRIEFAQGLAIVAIAKSVTSLIFVVILAIVALGLTALLAITS